MPRPGGLFRYARRGAGLTHRELGAKAGVPQETIARIEAGRVDPRIGTVDRLLEACEMGLEVMPRLGVGIDRTQFEPYLALSPSERLEAGIEAGRHLLRIGPRLKRVAE